MFQLWKIGHYASKCPHKKGNNEYDNKEKDKYRRVKNERNLKEENLLYPRGQQQPFDEERTNDCMFMAIEIQDERKYHYKWNEEKVVVDMEREFVLKF